MKRLLLFSHYNQQEMLSSYVVYILEKIKPFFERVIFVSNSKLNEDAQKRLSPFIDKIIERENIGFDFGAWKQAIFEEGWESIASYESMTIMNDTCFGPLYDFEIVLRKMENENADFWGLTNYVILEKGLPGIKRPIPDHVQSYFICFRRKVINSKTFRKFWVELVNLKSVEKLIEKHETQLTRILIKSGFKYAVFMDLVKDSSPTLVLNSLSNPDVLIQKNIPFVKVKSFLIFNNPRYIIQMIENDTEYDSKLIIDHFNHTYSPNISLGLSKKYYLTKQEPNDSFVNRFKVAIHFHVFYPDVFEKHIKSLSLPKTNFDLYITTESEEKKEIITKCILENGIGHKLMEIRLVENRGRDVLPWLLVSEKLNNYDIVGHFHAKKSIAANEWIGASWMTEFVETLIEPMDEIIELFEKDSCLGIVIPDIPYFFKKMFGIDMWEKTKILFDNLWLKMDLKKKLDLSKIDTPIMSYGTMFWYRSAALKPLFDLNLSKSDFPEEPLPVDGSMAHAIESLPVYIAWNQGYDFKIALSRNYIFSGFDNVLLNDLKKKQESLLESHIWKAGLFVTWLPRKLRALIKK